MSATENTNIIASKPRPAKVRGLYIQKRAMN